MLRSVDNMYQVSCPIDSNEEQLKFADQLSDQRYELTKRRKAAFGIR